MLEALVIAGMVAAPLGSAALFLPARHHERAGVWAAIWRVILAVTGSVVFAAAAAGVLYLLKATEANLVIGGAAVALAGLLWLPVTRNWSPRAHLCWASSTYLFAVYLVYALEWTFASHLGAASTVGGVLLWCLEVVAALMCCAYLWELCDALGTAHWHRRRTPLDPRQRVSTAMLRAVVPRPDNAPPLVSVHVPAHNEPPGMVIETLRALLRLDYPRVQIVVIDDNTDDEWLWRPVETWCLRHGVTFKHLENWPGYKSGALNYALQHLTHPDAEIIGVVDSDYQVEPEWLRQCVPLFADPWIGFVQAPQDYRDWQHARYYRRLYYSYKYFFAVSQPSRNERDGAIFAGTMGLIRRVALDQLGGWDEWCITEDAEVSLRLLRAGWSGMHVDESGGRGIMPLTFEALKGQRYRWCFGGIQLLRMHWKSLLPGRETRKNHLSAGQRWSYLSGALQWYGDLLGTAVPDLPAGRRGEPGDRRRAALPQADGLPRRRCPRAHPARPGPRDRAAAPQHRRVLARRPRRVLHLAVHLARGRPRLGPRPVREEGRLPAHPEDQRADQLVARAARQLGGDHPRALRRGRDRRRAHQDEHVERPAAGRPAARAHARHGRRTVQQLGRPPCRAPGLAARASQHRVPARAPRFRCERLDRRCDRRGPRGGARDRADAHRPPHHRPQPRPPAPVPDRHTATPTSDPDPHHDSQR